MTDPPGDLADELARQARELFGHLPPDEIDDDERLWFRTDELGRLQVSVGDAIYVERQDCTWRYRQRPDGTEEATVWKAGRLLGTVSPSWRPGDN